MAKATAPDTTALSVSEAATAIIAKAIAPEPMASPTPSEKAAAWRSALAEHEAAYAAEHDDEDTAAFDDKVSAATHSIWAAGATSWADVVLFAEMARYWMWEAEEPTLDAEYKTLLAKCEKGDHIDGLPVARAPRSRCARVRTARVGDVDISSLIYG